MMKVEVFTLKMNEYFLPPPLCILYNKSFSLKNLEKLSNENNVLVNVENDREIKSTQKMRLFSSVTS